MLKFMTDSRNLCCGGEYFLRNFAGRSFRQKIILILLIIFSSFSSYSIAGIQEKQDIPRIVQRSELIIRGKVISTESQWKEDSRGRHIYTTVTVKILDKIKGKIKDDAFAFEVVGGIVDDIGEVVSGTPVFEIDEEAIVFLAGHPLTIQHGTNGKILIYDGRVYLDGSEVTADSFIRALRILEQDPNAPISLGEKYQYPTAGVTAADCFIYSGYKWPGTSPVVYYKINQNSSDCIGEGAAVQRAADTWNNACDVVNFRFEYDGSCSSTGPSQNFINCITWGTLSSGTLGETTYWYYPSTGEIFECDVVFNDLYYTWSTDQYPPPSEIDVESVALHEFGHWLSLDDLEDDADSDKVMYGYIGEGEVKRWLRPCDIDGICYIYSCEGCPVPPPPCNECAEDEYLGTIGTVVWGYSVSGNCDNGGKGKWVGQFTGEAGATYHFDLCPDSPGSGTNSGFDPDIKITNNSCTILAGEDGSQSCSLSYSPNDYQWICTSNGTYYVIIAPYNSHNSHTCGGNSSDTFTLKYYKEGTCPPPTGVSASDGTYTDKVRITWNAVSSPCNYYRVYRATSSTGTKTALGSSCQTSTSYNDYNAIPGITYYYWVKSATNSSCSGASDYSSYDTGWRKLSPPTGVSATGTCSDEVCITWNGVNGASHYRVYRATSLTGPKDELGSWQTLTSFCDDTAELGITYYYWVKAAINSSGSRPSDYSAYDTGWLPTPPEAQDGTVTTSVDAPVLITLQATDEGCPDPPAALSYIITSLPGHGDINEPGSGWIDSVPYTLAGYGNEVEYIPGIGYVGQDSFTFKADDGGAWPGGGDSNEATISINVTGGTQSITISGHATLSNGVPVEGVLVTVETDGSSEDITDTTDANGYYEIQVQSPWSGSVFWSKDKYYFNWPTHYSDITEDLVVNISAFYQYSGGLGTHNFPYEIATPEDLNAIGAHPEDWDKYFVLVNDIDLSAYTGTQFNIIGNVATPFAGAFDGNGHTISNFTYSTTLEIQYNVGLFGFVNKTDLDKGVIKDLFLINPDMSIDSMLSKKGSLVGFLQIGTVSNCHVYDGNVTANYAGGLVGENYFGEINRCSFHGTITGAGTAGLVFMNRSGKVRESYSNAEINSYTFSGGLIGENRDSPALVSDCYSMGTVEVPSGDFTLGGGLIAINKSGAEVNRSYSTSQVSGEGNHIGGFVGSVEGGSFSDCFCDNEMSMQDNIIGTGSSSGIAGKTTTEMMQEATFTNWDFSTPIWTI